MVCTLRTLAFLIEMVSVSLLIKLTLWFPKFSRITNDFYFIYSHCATTWTLNMSIWNHRLINWLESFEILNAWPDSKIFHSSKSIVVPMNPTFVVIHASSPFVSSNVFTPCTRMYEIFIGANRYTLFFCWIHFFMNSN